MWPWSKYQPTTLLNSVAYFGFVAAAGLALWLELLPLWTAGVFLLVHIALVESGFFAWMLAIWAAKRQRNPSERSIWFRDRDLEADRRLSRALDDTRDQPWLR